MKIIVLGAAAGGGFPQWNANSPNNRAAFAGEPNTPQLTQCSLAVSANGVDWVLLNAAPDIRQQIIATRELHPHDGLRSSPIKSVVLTGADIDAIAGLLVMRERQAYSVWATDYVTRVIAASAPFNVLDRSVVSFREIEMGRAFAPVAGLEFQAIATPGKPPLYLESVDGIGAKDGASIGVKIRDAVRGKSLAFVPACSEVTPALLTEINGVDALFFDGTLYADDEMIRSGEGMKTGKRMGHVSMSDAIVALRDARAGRRYFIHVNNSNPALNRASPERRAVEHAGWAVAEDGMRIEL